MKIIENNMPNDSEIFIESLIYTEHISIRSLDYKELKRHLNVNIYLKSTLFILVLSGKGTIEINFKNHEVAPHNLMLLSFGHFFKMNQLSTDFKCLLLYVDHAYIEEMYSVDMLYKRVKYGVKMYKTPLLQLSLSNFNLLKKRFLLIDEIILESQHRYFKEMILNGLRLYFLDLSNIIEESNESKEDTPQQSREELHFLQFLNLLATHYQSEHLVDFYARTIHITPHHLTQIVKRLSGQTVADFIFQLLYNEAKLLLKQPHLPIQTIAVQLHFSDQSAFGKFFKRKSGISPRAYRNKSVIA